MSKNKKIDSVDPGTGAVETNGITDGGLRPMREYFTNDEVLPEGHPPPPYPALGNPDRV